MSSKHILHIYPDKAKDMAYVFKRLLNDLGLRAEEINSWEIVKRSIDARKQRPQIRLEIDVFINDSPEPLMAYRSTLKPVKGQSVHIIGAGPAGYFAALKLLENGVKPIIYERGKDVQARRRDLRQIQQFDNSHFPAEFSCRSNLQKCIDLKLNRAVRQHRYYPSWSRRITRSHHQMHCYWHHVKTYRYHHYRSVDHYWRYCHRQ